MRKCKCISNRNGWSNWGLNEIYYYRIINNTEYPYHIYTFNNSLIATFSRDVFDILFEDINKERKEKLLKLKIK